MRVRILGAGRAGTSLSRALASAGFEVDGPLGRGHDPAGAAAGVDLLVLAVPDGAVASVAAAVRTAPGTVVVHLSGSLGLDVLAPHERRASVHPLAALPDPEVGARRLASGIWFAVAGDPIAARVVDALGGRPLEVPVEHRVAYHAAACIAANHLVVLLAQAGRAAARAGVPLGPYLRLAAETVEDVGALGPGRALTGPAARGDQATLERHLGVLDPADRPSYRVLAAAARRLAAPAALQAAPGPGTPRVVTSAASFRAALDEARAAGAAVGLVPTMGALHAGHASLVERAAGECDLVAVTVFVNPLQFGAGEDFAAYPRDLDRDVRLAGRAGAGVVFAPQVAEMYPEGHRTTVTVAGVSEPWEGASRPGHLAGVATVVGKLFGLAGPCRAYFGEKDYQQLLVVRRLAADLSLPVEVVGCPTVREPDGLALSSRNAYLGPEEREAAAVLHRALMAGRAAVETGERDPAGVAGVMRRIVEAEPLAALDYAAAVDAGGLHVPEVLAGEVRLIVAARIGRARLIDNLGVCT